MLGQPLGGARPGAVGEDDVLGAQLLAGRGPHPGQALALKEAGDDLRPRPQLPPGLRQRRGQRSHQAARVDRRLAGGEDTAVAGRGQARLQLAATARC